MIKKYSDTVLLFATLLLFPIYYFSIWLTGFTAADESWPLLQRMLVEFPQFLFFSFYILFIFFTISLSYPRNSRTSQRFMNLLIIAMSLYALIFFIEQGIQLHTLSRGSSYTFYTLGRFSTEIFISFFLLLPPVIFLLTCATILTNKSREYKQNE
ncbi:MAG: hypothetical protein RR565_07460 [Erysipelothrix sp.]